MKDAFRKKVDKYMTAVTFAGAGYTDDAKIIFDEK